MAHWDQIDVDGSPMRLYVGMPSLGRAFPAVIVIQHGPGVDRFIQDRVETLSEQHGYLAIAPDLYHRQPEDGDMMTRIGRLRDPEVVNDVSAAVNYARRLKDTQLGDVGIEVTFVDATDPQKIVNAIKPNTNVPIDRYTGSRYRHPV